MEKYTIYCTKEQTKKALELGAPIKTTVMPKFLALVLDRPKIITDKEVWYLTTPTTEQMVGWLEENHVRAYVEPYKDLDNNLWYKPKVHTVGTRTLKHRLSRKEAILAAIDAALEYLANNKE